MLQYVSVLTRARIFLVIKKKRAEGPFLKTGRRPVFKTTEEKPALQTLLLYTLYGALVVF
jgi:hypothetical protein